MHAIKGGWVGQTFALAKCHDSGGKKSRIRRSKEERKALVESFIKKYQKLNNGSFPSLKLTREEVGGSFYTIREIVREVIQENRVLGPATFTPEEQNYDILEQYPIGSISINPETELLSANGSNPMTHILQHHQDVSLQGLEHENHSPGQMLYMDGSTEVVLNNEEHERQMSVVSKDRETLVLDQSVEARDISSVGLTYIEADSILEASPLTSSSGLTYGLDDKYSDVNGNTGEKGGESSISEKNYVLANEKLLGETEPSEKKLDIYTAIEEELLLNSSTSQGLEPEHHERLEINGSVKAIETNEVHEREVLELEGSEDDQKACEDKVTLVHEDVVEVFPLSPVSERTYGLDENSSDLSVLNENLGEKDKNDVFDETKFRKSASDSVTAQAIANIAVQELENCCNSVIETPEGEISEVLTLEKGTEVKDDSEVGIMIKDPVNGNSSQSPKDSKILSSEQKVPKKTTVDDLKETNATLDRMNLESWKTSDKSQKLNNPLLVLFKSFVTAFVKFWSE